MTEFTTSYNLYIRPGDRLRLTGANGHEGVYVVTEVKNESCVTLLVVLPRGNLRWVILACSVAFVLGLLAGLLT